MNTPSPQPPPVPCAKCGGRLKKVSALNLKCDSCGVLSRRVLSPDQNALFFAAKAAFVVLAFAPTVAAISTRLPLEKFIVLNAACSLIAGLGLSARLVRWWFTILAGLALCCGLFIANLIMGLILGCGNLVGH